MAFIRGDQSNVVHLAVVPLAPDTCHLTPSLAVAAGTQLAADAGAHIACAHGGNAVDAAIIATFISWVCEPGLTSIGSGGFITVCPPGEQAVTIDGFAEMPGRSADAGRFGGTKRVTIPYGGGVDTFVGAGAIATPGALAAVELAWRRWGGGQRGGRMRGLAWRDLIEPAIQVAAEGFPISLPSQVYFDFGAKTVLSETPDALRLCQHEDGRPRRLGERMTMPDLADTLRQIADEGAAALYRGELGRRIVDWIDEHGGLLGRDDLENYRAIVRPCLTVELNGWRMATNPRPAVGGRAIAMLAQTMAGCGHASGHWSAADVARFARAMKAAFIERSAQLASDDVDDDGETDASADDRRRDYKRVLCSPSTSHTSAVDRDGLACSITTSTGYSAGVVVPGTGVLLNNMLGEIELNPRGLHAQKPGSRLRSNMAPTVAVSDDGSALSLGAAGAERIVSALAQTWINLVEFGMPLQQAIDHARCHVEWRGGQATLAHEPGVDVSMVDMPTRAFDGPHMFFGGVQAAGRSADGRLTAAADPRREGGAAVG